MAIEVRQLRALVSVIDEGTFTDAAIALGTTQASVSRQVAALERELGVRLLQRTSRGAGPTSAGARIAPHARRLLQEAGMIAQVAANSSADVRVGYAWSALGRHTAPLQRRWSAEHPGSALIFAQSNTGTAGLIEGIADVAVTRRELDQRRFRTALIGTEQRCAALPADHPLAQRRRVRLHDFAGATVAIDARTGTTTEGLWATGAGPAAVRDTHGVDEWITLIAAGQAIGITSTATSWQHRRAGVAYRLLLDAPPIPIRLAWWRDDDPIWIGALVQMATELYAPTTRRGASANDHSLEPNIYKPQA